MKVNRRRWTASWMYLVVTAATVVLMSGREGRAQTLIAQPYVQPGTLPGPTGPDAKTILWLTDQTPGAFTVEYGWDGQSARRAEPERVAIDHRTPLARRVCPSAQ